MARMSVCLVSLLLGISNLVYGADIASRWVIQAPPHFSPVHGESGDSIVTITVADRNAHATFTIVKQVALSSSTDTFVTGDKLVLIGDAGNTQAVAIFDLPTRRISDWFFCYEPQRITVSLLAYVEFYPNHTYTAEPTDVVLIYNLQKTPAQNRLIPAMKLPPGQNGDASVAVGFPVFPEYNVEHQSYDNFVEDAGDAYGVLGPPFFLLLSSQRLVFVSSQGAGTDELTNELISVDLSHDLTKAAIHRTAIPKGQITADKRQPNFVEVVGMDEVQPFQVRLRLPHTYRVDSVLVQIPQ